MEQIKQYVEHTGCLMEFLSRALDDPAAARCGKCMNCTGRTQRQSVPPTLVQAAVDFLREDSLVLEPRKFWPKSVLNEIEKLLPEAVERFEGGRPKMIIPAEFKPESGRVLCIYGDAGWGKEVARGKYETGRLSDDLVNASADLIKNKWKPEPAPEWVTAIPSERHTELVRDFAQRLAEALGLPFLPALRKSHGAKPQKEMQNSAMQLRNVLKAFEVVGASLPTPETTACSKGLAGVVRRITDQISTLNKPPQVPSAPVLLVDDLVDSGWTLTVASVLLRRYGSGYVYPFALAKASPRGS
jgi:ATP-dependent DNA helicase RecQ